MSALAGTFSALGEPVVDAPILAAAPEGPPVLASTSTLPNGGFRLELPDPPGRVLLLAKARGAALGLATRSVDRDSPAPIELALEDHAPLHRLTVLADGDVPAELLLKLTPRRVAGIDEVALGLMYAPVDGVSESMLGVYPLGDTRRAEMHVQEGRWLLYAAHESAPDARGFGTRHLSWEVERATLATGEELERGVVGHELEVSGPTTVTLAIRVHELP